MQRDGERERERIIKSEVGFFLQNSGFVYPLFWFQRRNQGNFFLSFYFCGFAYKQRGKKKKKGKIEREMLRKKKKKKNRVLLFILFFLL